ncbi:hypothetical protein EPO17_00520 [Patescibacteria group bacterium]|nr:MAG: hypothetical protein EPO17_00520 [Patescibacteria group bacterium]
MKKPHSKGSLPREAVQFTQNLMVAGLWPGFFHNFTYDIPDTNLAMALVLGALGRISPSHTGLKAHSFTPIAINWKLEKSPAKHHDLRYFADQCVVGGFPGQSGITTQLQPALDETFVSVLQVNHVEPAYKHIRQLHDYKPGEHHTTVAEYAIKNNVGLGIVHALEVLEKLASSPRASVQAMTPIYGHKALGRSIYVLLCYQAFTDMRDLVGKPAVGLLESRVISAGKDTLRNSLMLTVHSDLNHPLHEGSLLVSANTPWFQEPVPNTDEI